MSAFVYKWKETFVYLKVILLCRLSIFNIFWDSFWSADSLRVSPFFIGVTKDVPFPRVLEIRVIPKILIIGLVIRISDERVGNFSNLIRIYSLKLLIFVFFLFTIRPLLATFELTRRPEYIKKRSHLKPPFVVAGFLIMCFSIRTNNI